MKGDPGKVGSPAASKKIPTADALARGLRIRSLRHEAGLSQPALARAMEPPTTTQTILRYEKGLSGIDGPALVALSRALGTTPEYIIQGDENAPPAFRAFVTRYAAGIVPPMTPLERSALARLPFHRATPESYVGAIHLMRAGLTSAQMIASDADTAAAQAEADRLRVKPRR